MCCCRWQTHVAQDWETDGNQVRHQISYHYDFKLKQTHTKVGKKKLINNNQFNNIIDLSPHEALQGTGSSWGFQQSRPSCFSSHTDCKEPALSQYSSLKKHLPLPRSSWPSVLELSSTNSRQFPLALGGAAALQSLPLVKRIT